jgi:hypothetical protein
MDHLSSSPGPRAQPSHQTGNLWLLGRISFCIGSAQVKETRSKAPLSCLIQKLIQPPGSLSIPPAALFWAHDEVRPLCRCQRCSPGYFNRREHPACLRVLTEQVRSQEQSGCSKVPGQPAYALPIGSWHAMRPGERRRCSSRRAWLHHPRLATAACGSLRCLRTASEHAAFPPVFSEDAKRQRSQAGSW